MTLMALKEQFDFEFFLSQMLIAIETYLVNTQAFLVFNLALCLKLSTDYFHIQAVEVWFRDHFFISSRYKLSR